MFQVRRAPSGITFSWFRGTNCIPCHDFFLTFNSFLSDFDECEDDSNNGCSQFCHNTIGGYHCSCHHGYFLDADKHTCTGTKAHSCKVLKPCWEYRVHFPNLNEGRHSKTETWSENETIEEAKKEREGSREWDNRNIDCVTLLIILINLITVNHSYLPHSELFWRSVRPEERRLIQPLLAV